MTEERKTESGELTSLPRPYEEKAYKYADKQAELYRGLKEPSGGYANIVDAYIAGATENGIDWHNVADGDFPKEDYAGLIVVHYKGIDRDNYALVYNQKALFDCKDLDRWCEIPQFKE